MKTTQIELTREAFKTFLTNNLPSNTEICSLVKPDFKEYSVVFALQLIRKDVEEYCSILIHGKLDRYYIEVSPTYIEKPKRRISHHFCTDNLFNWFREFLAKGVFNNNELLSTNPTTSDYVDLIKNTLDVSALDNSTEIVSISLRYSSCGFLICNFDKPNDVRIMHGNTFTETKMVANNLKLVTSFQILSKAHNWKEVAFKWQNNKLVLDYLPEEKERRALQYSAVLGGKDKQPRPYDVVLGGKRNK